MSSTAQAVKPPETSVGNWGKTFPGTVSSEKQSIRFMKKLMAISFSNIAYLRFNLPEDAFMKMDLDGLKFVILRSQTNYQQANTLMEWVKGAMDALEKGYLKDLIFIVYLNESQDEVYEMYKFTFGPKGFQVALTGSAAQGRRMEGKLTEIGPVTRRDSLYRETKDMMRRLILVTQGLNVLPDNAFLTIKISYQSHTPEEYQPPGFQPSSSSSLADFGNSATPPPVIGVGKVETRFHKVTAEVVSKGMYSPVRSQELALREDESGPIHPGSINLTTGLEDQFDDFDLSNADETGDGGSRKRGQDEMSETRRRQEWSETKRIKFEM